MDSISYVYISWTIHGMWMIYIHLKEEVINFQIPLLERSPSAQPCSSVSLEQNGYYVAQDFCAQKFSPYVLMTLFIHNTLISNTDKTWTFIKETNN